MERDDIDLFPTPPAGHDGELMNACFAVVAVLFVVISAAVAWLVGQ